MMGSFARDLLTMRNLRIGKRGRPCMSTQTSKAKMDGNCWLVIQSSLHNPASSSTQKHTALHRSCVPSRWCSNERKMITSIASRDVGDAAFCVDEHVSFHLHAFCL